MESRKIVFQETAIVAIGELLCCAIMVGVFALLSKFDMSVLLGALFGWALTVGNFFFMAIGTSLAADKAAAQDVKGGKAVLKLSQAVRYVALIVLLFALLKSRLCQPLPLLLPLVFVRPVLTFGEFFRKSGDRSK